MSKKIDGFSVGIKALPTAREREILNLVARGLTSKEIGQILEISPRTVQKHVDYICKKMQAKNKTHMAVLAVSLGWISDVPPLEPLTGE